MGDLKPVGTALLVRYDEEGDTTSTGLYVPKPKGVNDPIWATLLNHSYRLTEENPWLLNAKRVLVRGKRGTPIPDTDLFAVDIGDLIGCAE